MIKDKGMPEIKDKKNGNVCQQNAKPLLHTVELSLKIFSHFPLIVPVRNFEHLIDAEVIALICSRCWR